MARFTPKRYEQILARMIAKVVARTSLSDVADSATTKHILAASSRSDDELYYQMTLMLQLFSIDTAEDDDLDERAKDIQPAVITRILAQYATGTVTFSRTGTSGTTSVPIGTKIKTTANVVFTTTTTGTILNGASTSNGVGVVADVPGSAGNADGGTIVKFVNKPAGVDTVTNPSLLANGRDKETDDAFRARLKAFIAGLARCTVQALEAGVTGQLDPVSASTVIFAKAVEDIVLRGNVALYIDDGTGQVEAIASAHTELAAVFTWGGTTTITTPDTSEVVVGDWIRLVSDGQWFEVTTVNANTSVVILNPGSDTIPSGATASAKASDILTEGFDPSDEAVGGETVLVMDNFPIKDTLPIYLATSVSGNLIRDTDYTINSATGQVVLTTALVAGEQVVGASTYYTGLIAHIQKIVDGDTTDRANFPGFRAAGTVVRVTTPQILIQPVTALLTVLEGYTQSVVVAAATQAILDYVNALPISGDVLLAQLFRVVSSVRGVRNVAFTAPANDVIILDDQMARTTSANVSVT